MAGSRVVAISRNTDALLGLANVIPLQVDLSTEVGITTAVKRISEHYQTVDIHINNAGQLINKPFADFTLAEAESLFAINTLAPSFLVQGLLPLFKQGSHIVNIGSMGGYQGSAKFAGLSFYSASKAALACLTECLADELRPKGVAVNCLCLGAVETEMLAEAFPGYKAPVNATDMASYIAHFALTAHKVINGKVLPLSLSTP